MKTTISYLTPAVVSEYIGNNVITYDTNRSKTIAVNMSIDSHGRMIARSIKPISDDRLKTPFDGGFITINKQDAQNLYDMLTYAMDKIIPEEIEQKDIKVFGDKAISYERLYDYLTQDTYYIDKNKTDSK